ncbi:MAG: ATP-dependent helicase C-terminal domain-containing protein, partial [Thermoflexales bacterium]
AASDLRWVTPPPAGALRQALDLLQQLGAMQGDALTARGRAMLEWPTHPRLAHLLIEAQAVGGALPALAADVAALLDERDPLPRGSAAGVDLSLRVEALRAWRATGQSQHGADARALGRIERIAGLWRRQLNAQAGNGPVDPEEVARLIALAYPDRIARARARGSARYRMANGRGVRLPDGDGLNGFDWLAVAHLDDGSDEGRIHFAAPLREADLEALAVEHDVVGWDARKGALLAQRERRIGELVLSQRPLRDPPCEERTSTLCEAVRAEGLGLLTWTEATRQWQARMQSVRVWRGDPWPDVSDAGLLACLDDWLGPWLDSVSTRADFARLDTQTMLAALATRRQLAELDDLAPTHLSVPSGSSIRLEYFADGAAPVLAVKLQEMFGQADTPTINAGRTKVLLHLLSPAQRPIQVTQDLRSFWANTYPAVRKELRGRYNKHPWPEDPWTALPTRKTVKRARPS